MVGNDDTMKLTPDLKLTILEMVGIYAARLGISEPAVLLSTREVMEMPKHITRGRRSTAYKYYGVAYLQHNTIFINVRKIPDGGKLRDVVVHELVHVRFPYLSHGRRFDETIGRVMDGARFGPYRPRKARRRR